MLKYVYLIATGQTDARRERYLSCSCTILIHWRYEIPNSGILYDEDTWTEMQITNTNEIIALRTYVEICVSHSYRKNQR